MIKNSIIAIQFIIILFFLLYKNQVTLFSQQKKTNSSQAAQLDMEYICKTWLSWYNEERKKYGLKPYQYNETLNKTALNWCQISLKRGTITHKRDLDDSKFYNYPAIEEWFAQQGVTFKNQHGFTFTENTAWGYFDYTSGDYNEYVITRIKTAFDRYMSEKDKTNKWENAHYRSIIAPHFNYIGLGLLIDEENKGYYLVVHYATEVIEKP
ncbi:MAG: CAP domain-containing protein [Spirochaetes bacterium]|nr:CAP domain-containing protein [Spirochaetota bacterium]